MKIMIEFDIGKNDGARCDSFDVQRELRSHLIELLEATTDRRYFYVERENTKTDCSLTEYEVKTLTIIDRWDAVALDGADDS